MAEGDNQFRVVPEEPGQDEQPPEMLRAEPPAPRRAPAPPGPSQAVQSRLAGQPAAPADLTTQQREDMQGEVIVGADGTAWTMKPRAQPRGRGPAMATVEGKITQAPGLPGVRDAMEEQKRVQGRLTDAFIKQEAERAKILNETADAMEQESLRLGKMREQAMAASIAQTRQLQAQADEIGATAPQAGRLFGTGAQAASFGAALSIATGAMLSARTGGPNVALKIIDQAIARDMEVQKEAKQFAATMGLNLAQEMRGAYRDDLAASNAMQATLLRYSENRIAAMVAQTNDPILRARGDETIANIQLKYASLVEELTRQSYGLRMALPLRQAQEMIAASAGQTIAPESQQDAAAQAAGGGVGKAQAATEALGQNARQQAKQAEGKARGALKKRRGNVEQRAGLRRLRFLRCARETLAALRHPRTCAASRRSPRSKAVPPIAHSARVTRWSSSTPPAWISPGSARRRRSEG